MLAMVAALVWRPSGIAFAQETGVQEVHEGISGPYRVTVEVEPPFPIAGKVQFRVRPVDASTGIAVPDARIEIYLGRDGREEIKTPALNSPADRTTYIGNAEMDQAGEWNARVELKSNTGAGEFSFTMRVRPRARSGKGLVAPTLVYLGAALIVLGGVAWLVLASRRTRRRS